MNLCHVLDVSEESDVWTFEEDKLFEVALTQISLDSPCLFEKITSAVPGKTVKQIEKHFELLIADVRMIESGLIPLPNYRACKKEQKCRSVAQDNMATPRKRKPAIPWTTEEHGLFLEGLEKYGKGDWKSISKFMKSRTPAQVASHAQKHFLRLQNSGNDQNSNSALNSASNSKKKKNNSTSNSTLEMNP